MSRAKRYTQTFHEGLQTTGEEDGLRLPRFTVFQDVNVSAGPAARRKGIQLVDTAPSPHTALDLAAASSHHVLIPAYANVQTLGKRWTLEYLVNPDGVSGTQVIHGFAHATDWPIRVYLDDAVVTVDVTDSAGTVVTLTSSAVTAIKLAIMVVRSGTALSLWVNGVLEDSDTMADLACKAPGGDMYFFRDNTGNYYDGLGDFARAQSVVLTSQREGLMRAVDPRVGHVLWDYVFEIAEATTKRVDDRSSHGNHGVFVGTPATGAAQTVQVTPINLIHDYLDERNRSRLAVLAGAKMHLAEITP